MRDPLSKLEELARLARQERFPATDVAPDVLRRIGRYTARPVPRAADRRLAVFAMAAVGTAAVVMAFTFSLYQSIADPLWTLFQTSSW